MKKQASFGRLNRIVIFAGLLFLVVLPCTAQITPTDKLGPTTEYRDGYITLALPAQDTAIFTDQRTRFNLEWLIIAMKPTFIGNPQL
ncbi:MAG: hypothetical protein K8F54_08990 [Altibacter sp.]|uniref:hypothetical protein n=1 Tax=Altibacter sp. TaxID=2024823 RepID=UPI001D8F0729|nr:hypothetical protein [Altibacter sp.]MBZ0327725.1 hypothetical protein [Altibacter sp.]